MVAYPAPRALFFASESKPGVVVVCVLSVSYPLETLRKGCVFVARPVRAALFGRAPREAASVTLGASSVQRVGFSLASSLMLRPSNFPNLAFGDPTDRFSTFGAIRLRQNSQTRVTKLLISLSLSFTVSL